MGDVARSWFAVFNNPEEHGYAGSPQEICERLKAEWVGESATRRGAWAYCISADGLKHVHMVLEDDRPMRFSAVKKSYAVGMHFEATKGSKSEAEAYITKQPPYDEKGEQVLFTCYAGEIQGAGQGARSDLAEIEELIESGLTPSEIFQIKFQYRRYDSMIRKAFFDKRKADTPPIRELKVHYLVGESGSGKSYHYVNLCQCRGEESIFLLTDYDGGGFDSYQGEPVLFLDEYKGQFRLGTLLTILDKYKVQIHARYSNVWALWTEIYITSVFPPDELYGRNAPEDEMNRDKIQQLLRRITDITYCFVENGEHKEFTLPMEEYTDYNELVNMAYEKGGDPKEEQGTTEPEQLTFSGMDEFTEVPVTADDDLPFGTPV